MNAKYFEENGFEDFHGTKFHKAVLDHAACIANNQEREFGRAFLAAVLGIK